MRYKVGDWVRVRDWDDMAKEYGEEGGDIGGPVDGHTIFISDMEKHCGKAYVIAEAMEPYYQLGNVDDVDEWDFEDWMLESFAPAEQAPKVEANTSAVDHPAHYNQHKWEVIDIIEEYFKDNYHLGNVFKYMARCEYKGHKIEDLKKARWYLDRYIKKLEEEIAG